MSGAAYVLKEDKSILRYIIDGDYASLVAGNALWLQMQDEEVCPGRSWQSLKNRFKRSIAVDISRPEYGLSSDEKVLLRNAVTNKTKSKRQSDTRVTKKTSRKSINKHTHKKNESASSEDSDEAEPKVAVKTKQPKSTVGSSSATSSAPTNSDGREESATPEDKEFYSLDMEWSDSD